MRGHSSFVIGHWGGASRTRGSAAPRRDSKSAGLRTAKACGFTLIELVSVLAIIVVLLSIMLGSYFGWARVTGVDTAANLTSTIISHARELAITQRVWVEVSATNTNTPNSGRPDCAVFSLYDWGEGGTNAAGALAMPPCRLPPEVRLRSLSPISLWFHPDGTCHMADPSAAVDGCARLTLDGGGHLSKVVEVTLLSGRVRVRREDEP